MGHYDNSYEEEAVEEAKKARAIADDQFNKSLKAFRKKATVEDLEKMESVIANWHHIKRTFRIIRWIGGK